MMTKAEMASEMIRSRSQTPIPLPTRTVGAVASGATITCAVGDGACAELGSEDVAGMLSYCIQNLPGGGGLKFRGRASEGHGLSFQPSSAPGYNNRTRGNPMTRRFLQNKIVHRSLTLAFLFLVTLTMSAQWSSPQEEGGVPAYNAGPPPKGTKLPRLLTKADLWGADAEYAYQTHAYELAAKIPNVLHQQPCYCYCDRMGHNSLHSCFENTHGAQCSTCLKELYYSYQQSQKGKTASQIRAGIIKGEWKQVDLQSAVTIN